MHSRRAVLRLVAAGRGTLPNVLCSPVGSQRLQTGAGGLMRMDRRNLSGKLLSTPAWRCPSAYSANWRCFGSWELTTPSLGGESIKEGTIMEWKKRVGDSVRKGDILVVIETDKVTVEVPADQDGHVQKILANSDETVAVGQALCVLASGSAGGGNSTAPKPATMESVAAPTPASGDSSSQLAWEVKVPGLGGESITEGTLMGWRKKIGESVKAGEVLVAIETDKIQVDVPADKDGYLAQILVEADNVVAVGQALCKLKLGNGIASAPVAEAAVAPAKTAAAPATPRSAATLSAGMPTGAPAKATSAPATGDRKERREKMKRMRLAIAKNLKLTQDTMAMLTTFQEVDMSNVMALRSEYKDLFEKTHGSRLGFMSFFMKASANALLQIPAVNAYIDNNTQEIVYRDYVDVSFAAATPRGLVTPVVRNVHSMSIKQIEESYNVLTNKAKKDTLQMDEIMGSTFTISNGGVFGSMLGTPLIGSIEQAAILGLHATKNRPVVLKSGEIAVRPVMYLALTYDHRLVDGREAVTFLCQVRDQIEDARRLILEL